MICFYSCQRVHFWTIDQLNQVGKQGFQYKYDIVNISSISGSGNSHQRVSYSDLELGTKGYIEAAIYKTAKFDRSGSFEKFNYEGYFLHEVYSENSFFKNSKTIDQREFEACRIELLAHKTK